MSSLRIDDFLFDEENEEEIAAHGLSINQVIQMLEHVSITIPNRKHRRGLYLMVGRDNGGTCISSPIEPAYRKGLWRPITAWPSKKGEETELIKREKYER
jgi:uncharacterized DUF497 family protein